MSIPEEQDRQETLEQRLLKKQQNLKLIDQLTGFFIEKKRLTKRGYVYRSTSKDDEFFEKAAEICKLYEVDPGVYVDLMYSRMTRTEFFRPACLQGVEARMFIKDKVSNSGEAGYDSNFSIEPVDLWDEQVRICGIYTSRGIPIEDVLIDSGIKLYAWFRLLYSEKRIQAVLDKYQHIAREEMSSKLREFIKLRKLDINRIIGAK